MNRWDYQEWDGVYYYAVVKNDDDVNTAFYTYDLEEAKKHAESIEGAYIMQIGAFSCEYYYYRDENGDWHKEESDY